MKQLCYVILLFVAITSCSEKKESVVNSSLNNENFEIRIRHFYGAEGEIINWVINSDSLKVIYNCDFEGCKDTLLLRMPIDSKKSKLYFSKVKNLKLDQLNNVYEKFGLKDGLEQTITLNNIYDNENIIRIHGIEVEKINQLYTITDSLFHLEKTQFEINGKH